jgi:VWFA-related protein
LNILPIRGSIEVERVGMSFRGFRAWAAGTLALVLCCATCAGPAAAQNQPQAAPSSEQQPPPQPSSPQQPAQQPSSQQQPSGYAITVSVPLVNVDVVITDNSGNYLSGLKKGNFRILEDGVPQTVTNFSSGEGPFTMVLLTEYSKLAYGYFLYKATSWAYAFLRQLRPQDWIALMSFDTRPHIEVDFTHNPQDIAQGLAQMNVPFFSESNLFDALVDALDRMRDVKGRKAILLLASGIDTFSRINLSTVLNRLKENDVTIFCVGVGEQAFIMDSGNLTYLQAQNQLRTFAGMSGGRAWFPRFDGEIPGIMSDVAASLRNQYSLAYSPMNTTPDGKYRKIKVEVVDADGKPLVVKDQKGKKVDMHIYARQGYQAPSSSVN